MAALKPYALNARVHSDDQVKRLVASIREWGFTVPVLVDVSDTVIAGHGRLLAAAELGLDTVPVMVAKGWSAKQIRAYRLADNRLAELSTWDAALLAADLGALVGMEDLIGFDAADLASLIDDPDKRPLPSPEEARQTLAERFGLPPFSVLNAREGWWQERKRAWLGLGIESELGRGENLLKFSETINEPDPDKREAMRKKGGVPSNLALGQGGLSNQVGKKRKANGKTAARTFGQDLMRGEHVVGGETASLKGGLTWGTTMSPYAAKKRAEKRAKAAKA